MIFKLLYLYEKNSLKYTRIKIIYYYFKKSKPFSYATKVNKFFYISSDLAINIHM